jgi:hypothetical protein
VQKALLPSFDLHNAFASTLNDWAKEVTECFNFKQLHHLRTEDLEGGVPGIISQIGGGAEIDNLAVGGRGHANVAAAI